MRGQKLHSGLFQTLRLTFIGLFFNLVVPGSVGGDVFKAYYVSKDHVGSKIKAVTSILIDRILGLYAISLIAFFAIIFEWQTIMASGRLKSLAFFIFSLTFAFSLFFALGFSRRIRKHKFINFILKKVPGGGFIEKAYDAVHAFRHGKKEFIIGIGLSLISQGQMVYILFVIAKQLHFITTIGECFFVIPVGFMATAIPISPAGIGVGQVVFYKLFHWYSGVDSSLGPTLITINQLCFVFLGLIGAISYLFYKGKGKKHG